MKRDPRRALLISLAPSVIVGAVVGLLLWPPRQRPELEIDGGTVLVYEVNLERTAQRNKAVEPDAADAESRGLSSAEMEELAGQIRRRLDPDGGKNVAVRAVNDRRVEVSVPADPNTPASHAEEIDEVLRLLSQMGVLEFRIVANGVDDLEGIREAQQDLAAQPQADRDRAAAEGQPPPGGRPGGYHVAIGETEAQVRYVWAELGPQERDTLFLTSADEKPSPERVEQRAKWGRGELWQPLAAKRNQVVYLAGGSLTDDPSRASMVLFSRECTSREQLAIEVERARRAVAEGRLPAVLVEGNDVLEIHKRILADPRAVEIVNPKKVEYFVLTRVSPVDSLRVGEGNVTIEANASEDQRFNPAVGFRLNEAGAERFGALTRRNSPSNNHERSLAILLDGRVVSAASIKSEIGADGQITGSFDRPYVESIVQILNSGALSAELKEKPVSTQEVAPTQVRKPPLGKATALSVALGAAILTQLVCLLVYWRMTSGGSSTAASAAPPWAKG